MGSLHIIQIMQGFVCVPETFECEITARDEMRARLIRGDWQSPEKEYIDDGTGLRQDAILKMRFSYVEVIFSTRIENVCSILK